MSWHFEMKCGNKNLTREYNNRTVYDWLNNTFQTDCGRPYLNQNLIPIDDRTHPHKIYHYTPDIFPDTISVASENYVSSFTNPSYMPQILLLTYDDTNYYHYMKKYEPYRGKVKRGYYSRKRAEINSTPCALIKTGDFITVLGVPLIIHIRGLSSWNIIII